MSVPSRIESQPLPLPNFSLARAASYLVDLIFPPACGSCGRVDYRFCVDCQRRLRAAAISRIPCQVTALDAVAASGKYSGILQSALQSFKYESALELAPILAQRLISLLKALAWSIDCIVPVPLHHERLTERGYNQSQLLSESVALSLDLPCQPDMLQRIRETSQQARLSQEERRANVQGAFAASASVAGTSLLLIDDVVTTGSTLSACATALRAQDARTVYAIAVSRA